MHFLNQLKFGRRVTSCGLMAILLLLVPAGHSFAKQPNVILIMTDDQGYGDLSCHGNPVLKTPQLDELFHESVRLTDFHVSPFCTPTRAALMTGRYPARTGAYRTSSGRTMLHPEEQTLAHLFADAGYVTGMVGKWHLGDNAPHRPQDRGFQHVVWHRCGGVGQASDYFGNDYFDDVYERNGTYEQFEGYCTDIWFAEAKRFIEANQSKPFFLYLAPNAPHSPYRVPPEWSEPYCETVTWKGGAEFYGMIANIDHNLGLLRRKLTELRLSENTILIFMTDNGTANGIGTSTSGPDGYSGFNAGMRGKKSTVYEGGHRVPFFIHWPAGGLTGGRDATNLTAHIDVLPTLAALCDVPVPESHQPDGCSFTDQLTNPDANPHRDHYVAQLQGGAYFAKPGAKWDTSCVLKGRWRLLNGDTLYNLEHDPAQRQNVTADHPETVAELRDLYEQFWTKVSTGMTPVSIDLGNPAENPTTLCSQDWYLPEGNPPWNFGQINRRPQITGPWHVNVKQAGRYRFELRQLPKVASRTLAAVRARIEIAGQEHEAAVLPHAQAALFELDLPAGATTLKTWLFDATGEAGGAYFTDVKYLQSSEIPVE
jgi:arylsulfatase A-like enzyme